MCQLGLPCNMTTQQLPQSRTVRTHPGHRAAAVVARVRAARVRVAAVRASCRCRCP